MHPTWGSHVKATQDVGGDHPGLDGREALIYANTWRVVACVSQHEPRC